MRLNFNTEFYSLALFVRPRDSCLKEPITKSLTILIQLKRKSCNTNEVNGIKKIIFTQLHVKLKIYYHLEPMGLVNDV
jgi:hypothetical protein